MLNNLDRDQESQESVNSEAAGEPIPESSPDAIPSSAQNVGAGTSPPESPGTEGSAVESEGPPQQGGKPKTPPLPDRVPHEQQMAAMNPQKKFSMADLNAVNYEMLVDVPIKVTVELGRSQMTVQEILGLEKGSVIELDRIAGDPVDVFVNDYLIAKGEVVVVDDNFGVRITKIIASHSLVGKN